MKPLSHSYFIRSLLVLTLYLSASIGIAKEIQLIMPNKQTALAEYRPHDKNKPAVLILHGFLQTSDFNTIQFIADELSDNDYSVIAPTLSLNKNKRRQSLPCNSIHTHNVEENNYEIKQWVSWLKKQGYKSIVFVGHSIGNLQLVSYLKNNADPAYKLFIAISPGTAWNTSKLEQTRRDIKQANKIFKTSPKKINKYSLGFCEENYNTTAKNFLSYANWTESVLLESFSKPSIDTHIIIGDSDAYIPVNWDKKLRKKNISVSVIEGANHFFNGDAEFTLQDNIISTLEK